MRESAEDYYARVAGAAGPDGRLPTLSADATSEWDIFLYETESLRVRPLQPLLDAESPRRGEDPADCWCADPGSRTDDVVWHDAGWVLRAESPPVLPVWLALSPRAHVNKWGDGGAHLHLQPLGRPARTAQLLGSCLPDWTEHLPPLPDDVAAENVRFVVALLVAAAGGTAAGSAAGTGGRAR
ncbi:MAG: hypothetical protein M3Y26_04155 [Actinomycetota bacterium]|nr:hypothetical protein [Actinomycetota bacterium]